MKSSIKTITAVAVALVRVATAQAAVENFDGYSGSLFGQSGGTTSGGIAWNGSWADAGFGFSAGLVASSIGSVNGFSSTSPYAEYVLGSPGLESIRGFTPGQSGSTFYTYGLVSVGSAGGFGNSFGGIGLYALGTEKFLIGERFGASTWGVATANLNGAGSDSSVSIGNFSVALLLARIDQSANTLEFWVNPDFNNIESGANNVAAKAFTLSYGGSDDSVDTIRIRGGNASNGNTWQFDNLNVTQVSPFGNLPEPTAVSLITLGLAALAVRHRSA